MYLNIITNWRGEGGSLYAIIEPPLINRSNSGIKDPSLEISKYHLLETAEREGSPLS